MNILFVIKAMDGITGGAERVLADVSAGLSQRRHQVSLLSFDKPGGAPFYPLHKNVRRICFGIGDVRCPSRFIETLTRIKALRRTVVSEKPDVVIAFMHSMFIPAAIALVGTGIPVIASEHIVPQHYRTRRREFVLLVLCGLLVRRITVLSARVKELYPKILQRRMVVMPNLVNPPIAFQKKESSGRKIILNVGRLDPQKDQKTLITAFALLADKFPAWDVHIVGAGALEGELRRQISELGLVSRILLPGTTPEIGREYSCASIFALPSLYEGFGLVTVEAMSYGLPVLGFADCPGTNEIISDGKNGLLAKGGDRVTAFVGGLEQLMSSEDLRARLGQRGLETVKQFSPEKIIDQWEALICEVAACAASQKTPGV